MSKETKEQQSLAAIITDLKVGASFAKAQRIPFADVNEDDLKAALTVLRNSLNQLVSRLRVRTGHEFRVESGTMTTDDQAAILAVVVVTKLKNGRTLDEDEGSDDDDIGI